MPLPTFNVGPGVEELEKLREVLQVLSEGGVDVSLMEVGASVYGLGTS